MKCAICQTSSSQVLCSRCRVERITVFVALVFASLFITAMAIIALRSL